MSSEETARRLYEALDAGDKQIVDAWRDLGNDLTTSLLNSRVLISGPRRRAVEDLAGFAQRVRGDDAALLRRQTAEHEAAHAVVARALGVGVFAVSIVAGDGYRGETRHAATSPRGDAIIASAAEVWVTHFRSHMFPAARERGFWGDRRAVARATGGDLMNVRDAARRAAEILADRRAEVLALADWLEREGTVVFDGE